MFSLYPSLIYHKFSLIWAMFIAQIGKVLFVAIPELPEKGWELFTDSRQWMGIVHLFPLILGIKRPFDSRYRRELVVNSRQQSGIAHFF